MRGPLKKTYSFGVIVERMSDFDLDLQNGELLHIFYSISGMSCLYQSCCF